MLVSFTPSAPKNIKVSASIPAYIVNEPSEPDEITGTNKGRIALEVAKLQAEQNNKSDFKELKQGDFITLVQGLGKDNSIKDFLSVFVHGYKAHYPLCKIERIEELSDEELNNYDFMNQKPEGFEGGSFSFVYDLNKHLFTPTKEMLSTVILSVCMLRTPSRCLFVDPQGYNYSRYILALPGSFNTMFPEYKELQEEERRKEEEAKRAQEEKERAELEYIEFCRGFLTPVNSYDYKSIKKNVLAMLKYKFEGVKFTARKTSGSYCISWTDGPTEKEVKAVCNQFVDHEIDYSGDYNDYKPTLFTETFGGFEWSVDTNRSYSETVLNQAVKKVKEEYPEFTGEYNDSKCKAIEGLHESSFVTAEMLIYLHALTLREVVDIHLKNTSFYQVSEATTAASGSDGRQEPETTASSDTNESKGLTLIQYSAKAVALIGDTFPLKEQLKKLGGRWNARLTCGAGWVFSRKKENELRAAFNLA